MQRLLVLAMLCACTRSAVDDEPDSPTLAPERPVGTIPHDPIGAGFSGPMGSPMPLATAAQLEAFYRGEELARHRYTPEEGLGPQFNAVSCASCHERPVLGGGGELYRNMYMAGRWLEGRGYILTPLVQETEPYAASDGMLRMYNIGQLGERGAPAQLRMQDDVGLVAARNPAPIFGTGAMFAIYPEAIVALSDPDDLDGDGISGRPNLDFRGTLPGRLGTKAMGAGHTSILRIELYMQSGLSMAQPTQAEADAYPFGDVSTGAGNFLDAPNDSVPDPEVGASPYSDLMHWAQLLAAPEFDLMTEEAAHGRDLFEEIGCADCHIPRLDSPLGPVPVYTDFMLHDMGDELWDGYFLDYAFGGEFKTTPLWGIVATGPYLHDGRARTLGEAVRWHGGEAERARAGWDALPTSDKQDLLDFLGSLGGADLYTPGLLPPNAPILAAGSLGGPLPDLSAVDAKKFADGRLLFDRSFGIAEGLGSPMFNGDACRACHFDPVIGGSGPLDVNVIRGGHVDENGRFTTVSGYEVIKRMLLLDGAPRRIPEEVNVLEHRQTPPLFGIGLLDEVFEASILALADPDDRREPFGISGRVSRLPDGRLGRFGWKADVPTVFEFTQGAMSDELGLTVPPTATGLQYGATEDDDDRPDPEADEALILAIDDFVNRLAPPPRGPITADVRAGEAVFERVGCADCHVPTLPGPKGAVRAYTDLLLHEVLPEGVRGIVRFTATEGEFRTAPLWAISATGPYMHDGLATTLEDAVRHHDGEAAASRDAWAASSASDRAKLLAFLESL